MSTTATARQWWLDHADRRGLTWAKHYWNDWQAPHRQHLVGAVGLVAPVASLYEIGCNCGPNLRLLHQTFPALRLGGLECVELAVDFGNSYFAEPIITRGVLPEDLPETPWDVVLSCYTLAYLDPEDAHVTMLKMHRMARRAVILLEPMAVGSLPLGQCRDDGLPEWRHDYEKTFGALGWRLAWKWPLMPPVQNANVILVLMKE